MPFVKGPDPDTGELLKKVPVNIWENPFVYYCGSCGRYTTTNEEKDSVSCMYQSCKMDTEFAGLMKPEMRDFLRARARNFNR